MKTGTVIVTTVGLVIGVAEALLYYNLGQSVGKKFAYKLPPKREFLKTIGVVMVTSILTAAISSGIEGWMTPEEKTKS